MPQGEVNSPLSDRPTVYLKIALQATQGMLKGFFLGVSKKEGVSARYLPVRQVFGGVSLKMGFHRVPYE